MTVLEKAVQYCYSEATKEKLSEREQLDLYIFCLNQQRQTLFTEKSHGVLRENTNSQQSSPLRFPDAGAEGDDYKPSSGGLSQEQRPDNVQPVPQEVSKPLQPKLEALLPQQEAPQPKPEVPQLKPEAPQPKPEAPQPQQETPKAVDQAPSQPKPAVPFSAMKILDIPDIEQRFIEAEKRIKTVDPAKLKAVGYPGIAIHRRKWSFPIDNQCSNKEMNFLVMVPSAPKNFEARSIVRQTWGSKAEMGKINSSLLFVVGLTTDSNVQKMILEESAQTQDLVQLDMYDAYYNLTLKSLGMLDWASTHCKTAKYVAKVDDDNVVNFPNILKAANDASKKYEKFTLGSYRKGGHPSKGGKWADPVYGPVYKQGNNYPVFLGGPAYIMTNNFLGDLVSACSELPFIHLEDVFVNGICGERIAGLVKLSMNGMSMAPIHACSFLKPGQTVAHNYKLNNIKPTWDKWHDPKICVRR